MNERAACLKVMIAQLENSHAVLDALGKEESIEVEANKDDETATNEQDPASLEQPESHSTGPLA